MTNELDPIEPSTALELYLDHREDDVAASTYRAHRIRLQHFLRWCDEQDIDNLNALSGRDLQRYRLWRRDEGGLNKVSVRTQMSTLKVFVRFCAQIDAVTDGLEDAVDVPTIEKGENARDVTITIDRVEPILERLRQYDYASRKHVLVRLLWHTGARLGALRALDLEDVDANENYLNFRHRPEMGTPLKNGKSGERYVSLDEGTVQVISDWIKEQRPEVTDEYGREALLATKQSGRLAKTSIRRTCYLVTRPQFLGDDCPCDVAEHNYTDAGDCEESVSPHAFRRGAITHRLREETSKEVIGDRCDVGLEVLEEHYNQLTEREKMEQRRKRL